MEQLRQQVDQDKNSNRILGAVDNLLALEKRKELEKGKKEREDNVIKDTKKLFTLKEGINDNTTKTIRKLFSLKKDNEAIKHQVIRDFRKPLEQDKKDYFKSVGVGNFWNRNYIEYESNGDRNKTIN